MYISILTDEDWSVLWFFSDFSVILFSSSIALALSRSLFVVQTTWNFGANQWNRLGTFGMNRISFRCAFFFVFTFCILLIASQTFTIQFFLSFLLFFFICVHVCRVNLTMKFSQMTTYSSFQHSMVDERKKIPKKMKYGQ